MGDAVHDYILSMLTPDNPLLLGLGRRYERRTDIQPAVGPEVGKLLGLLVRLAQATRVLEMGTCLGYSTVWLAQAMEATDGQLTSVELDHALVEETRRSVEAAGLSHRVLLIEGDAGQVLRELTGPFDLILQDSAKPLYPELLERSVQLTRVGGILAADDALFKPMGIPAKFSDPVHQYNTCAASDPRLYTTILPIGDGLTVSLKLHD
ncbi:MAG: O-methyltransferase [Caldiserica bacterium]|nr:O-methyltransferase [Caldisericota bacterium]